VPVRRDPVAIAFQAERTHRPQALEEQAAQDLGVTQDGDCLGHGQALVGDHRCEQKVRLLLQVGQVVHRRGPEQSHPGPILGDRNQRPQEEVQRCPGVAVGVVPQQAGVGILRLDEPIASAHALDAAHREVTIAQVEPAGGHPGSNQLADPLLAPRPEGHMVVEDRELRAYRLQVLPGEGADRAHPERPAAGVMGGLGERGEAAVAADPSQEEVLGEVDDDQPGRAVVQSALELGQGLLRRELGKEAGTQMLGQLRRAEKPMVENQAAGHQPVLRNPCQPGALADPALAGEQEAAAAAVDGPTFEGQHEPLELRVAVDGQRRTGHRFLGERLGEGRR